MRVCCHKRAGYFFAFDVHVNPAATGIVKGLPAHDEGVRRWCRRAFTELVSCCEGRRKAVVFDHGAAPLGVAHGANVSHAESVTCGGSAQILNKEKYKNYMGTFTLCKAGE